MRHRLIRLNPSHFVVLLAGVALVMLSLFSVAEPWAAPQRLLPRTIAIPARRWGHRATAPRESSAARRRLSHRSDRRTADSP